VKLAQIAPLYEAVPPEHYGGTERVIAALCDGLIDRGHDVTVFAARKSTTRARLHAMGDPLRERMSRHELAEVAPHLHLRMLADVYDQAEDFDLIHSHLDVWTLPFARRSRTPSLLTMHGRLDTPYVQAILPLYPEIPLISVSDSQRTPLRHQPLSWAATVYNGLDLREYADGARSCGEPLAFVGRISPEKGPTVAIEIARRTGRELRIAAKVDPMDMEYFQRHVEPLFGSGVTFVGEVKEQQKPSFYGSAAATLFPSDWPEPFGLVMIESLAAGTPVIALRRGSVPEVLVDGVTGFICDDAAEMAAAVSRLDEIDPEDCRRRARQFGADVMCNAYEAVYRPLLDTAPSAQPARRLARHD
jgi:glycosyltransferase involved in cell wall biosynthesis